MSRQFKYFAAPHSEIYDLETRTCAYCGESTECCTHQPDDSEESKPYCLDCLSGGRVTLYKETEIGDLYKGRLVEFDPDVMDIVEVATPPGFSPDALAELPKTPRYRAHQSSVFLVHCNDFMEYSGRWEPKNFEAAAPEDPRRLYVQMADGDSQLWDDTEREKAANGEKWPIYTDSSWAYGSWCYVFKCIHCGKLRCHWDCG